MPKHPIQRTALLFIGAPLSAWLAGVVLYHKLPAVDHAIWAWLFGIMLIFAVILTFRIRAGSAHMLARLFCVACWTLALFLGMGIYSKVLPLWSFWDTFWFTIATVFSIGSGWSVGSALWGRRWLFEDEPQPDANVVG